MRKLLFGSLILMLTSTMQLSAQTLEFTCGGFVGSDTSASGIQGPPFGNTRWFVNGNQLAAGDMIEFTYTIDSSATDTNPDPNVGRFGGGTLTVSIPAAGIANVAATASYELQLAEDAGGTLDQIRMIQAGDTGLQCTTRWLAAANPFADVNQLGLLPTPIPPVGDSIGTSAVSQFSMTLDNGDVISTGATELFENPFFFQTTIFPQTIQVDVDQFNGPADETEMGFVRMSDPVLNDNVVNASSSPTVEIDGITVTATQSAGSNPEFRDRGGDNSNLLPPFQDLTRDLIGSFGSAGATVEVTVANLPGGEYLFNSFHFDAATTGQQRQFDLFLDDANGTNQFIVDDAQTDSDGPLYLGEAYRVSSNGTDDVVLSIVEDNDFDSVKFNGMQIIPIVGNFAPTGVEFMETQIANLNPNSSLVFEIEYDGVGELKIDTFGTSDATDTEIALFDANGMLLGQNDDIDPPARHSELVFDDLNCGTYYLAIGGFNTSFADGFSVDQSSVGFLAGDVTLNVSTGNLPLVVGVFDVIGPTFDDSDTSFLDANKSIYYQIEYDGAGPLTIDTNASPDDIDTEIALFDSTGILIDQDDQGGDGNRSLLEFGDELEAGTYYLAVGGWVTSFADGFSATPGTVNFTPGDVVVTVTTGAFPPATAGSFNVIGFSFAETQVAVDPISEFYDVTYDGLAPMTIEGNGVSFGSTIALFDENGVLLGQDSGTPLSQLVFNDLDAGNYYLAITADGGSFADGFTVSPGLGMLSGSSVSITTPELQNVGRFDLVWSGASFGNTAEAIGSVAITELLPNPGDVISSFGLEFIDFEITVSGSTSGNGTFTTADFDNLVWDTDGAELDLTSELVGQATSNGIWGTPDGASGDFNVFRSNPSAPNGTFFFTLSTSGGDQMLLTNFRPQVPGDVNCDGVANLLDVQGFVEAISNNDFDSKADTNGDGVDNLLDIESFIAIIGG